MKKIIFLLTLVCSAVLGGLDEEYAQVRANVDKRICKDSDFVILDRLCKAGHVDACLDMDLGYSLIKGIPISINEPNEFLVDRDKRIYRKICIVGNKIDPEMRLFYDELGCKANSMILCAQAGARSYELKRYCESVKYYEKVCDSGITSVCGSQEYLTSIVRCPTVSHKKKLEKLKKACRDGIKPACYTYKQVKKQSK